MSAKSQFLLLSAERAELMAEVSHDPAAMARVHYHIQRQVDQLLSDLPAMAEAFDVTSITHATVYGHPDGSLYLEVVGDPISVEMWRRRN